MKALKAIDFLGIEPQTFIFKARSYKTIFSSVISLITLLAIIILSTYFSTLVFDRKQMSLISGQSNDFVNSLDFNKIPILLFASRSNGEVFNYSVYYPIMQMWTYYPEYDGTPNITDIPLKTCEESDFLEYSYLFTKFVNLNTYLCINRSGLNLTIFGTPGDYINGYNRIQIYNTRCVNNSIYNPKEDKNSCMSPDQINTVLSGSPMHFYVTYPDNVLDMKNSTNPFNVYLRTDDFSMPVLALYKYTYFFKKTTVHSDCGYVFEDNQHTATSFQFDKIESTLLLGSKLIFPEAFGQISFVLSSKADIHFRSYIKIQSLLANIGGVINCLYLMSKFIVWYFTYKIMLLKYFNNRVEFPIKNIRDFGQSSTYSNTLNNFKLIQFSSPPTRNSNIV
jgi:hypothetical protein